MILVGVTGGIAAFKTLELVKRLIKHNLDVRVIMTRSATAIAPPGAFEKITGNRVYINLFEKDFNYTTILRKRRVEHIELANRASLFVIVPATANVIAKIAHGLADDYLTTTALAATCPILVCPSMNVYMWRAAATQDNIAILQKRGILLAGPDRGMLACGYEGEGRLIDVTRLTGEILRLVSQTQDLKGKRVVVTAGGTIEPIDDVRVITNRSSGKMGVALAEACRLRGARVTLLRSHSSVLPRVFMEEKMFDTAEELTTLLKDAVPTADICFHVAAVSDFTVAHKQTGKISSEKPLPLELTPRTKILDRIKQYNSRIFLVAFKAEWNVSAKELVDLSKKRLNRAGADLIVANDVGRAGRGFQSDDNEVVLIENGAQPVHIPLSPKHEVAEMIVNHIVRVLALGSALRRTR